MGAVTLGKLGDGVTEIRPGAGANSGSGPVQFIGDVPVTRMRGPRPARSAEYVTGGRVRVCGIRIGGHRAAFLDVNGRGGTAWIMADGRRVQADEYRTVGDWFRFLLDSGTFAGVEFLR